MAGFLIILIQSKIELDKTFTSCSESNDNGVEMKITVAKAYLEMKFPSRVKDFDQSHCRESGKVLEPTPTFPQVEFLIDYDLQQGL